MFVVENIATTTFEMHFYNNNNRVMEGEFNFPLGQGVTISRFALDVNGEMREGVVVEKETATRAFEAVTRRIVDPGIAEVTKGNNFRSRVYPIPANGYKKAIVAFEQELSGDNENYIYQLPLHLKHTLSEFSVKVEVLKNVPGKLESDNPMINLSFSENRNVFISEYKQNDILLDTKLAFAIPKAKEVNEVSTYRGVITSDNYFYINLNIEEENRIKPRPSSIAVIWDESLSGENRDVEKELKILERYFKWMESGTIL